MIKLVAIDLDGTLLNSERRINPAVIQAIRTAKSAGVKIVITTGRPLMGVLNILDELGLQEQGDFVITYNGALIQKAHTGEEILKETISRNDFLDIDAAVRKIGLYMMGITRDGIYTSQRDIGKYVVREAEMVKMPLYYRTSEEIAEMEIVKVMIVDEPDVLDKGITYLPSEFYKRFSLMKSTPFYLEVVNQKVNKGNAVKRLSETLSLQKGEIMAIGDEENDRSMLEIADIAVVMENGKEELKKIATHITKSNDNDGVAWAINEWVLKN